MHAGRDSASFSTTGPAGHRARMRGRLLAGPQALADYEIVEMLLFLGVPRRDTKPQAKGLLIRFGSLAAVLTASRDELSRAGVAAPVATAFAVVEDALGRLSQAERLDRVHLGDWTSLERYLDLPARAQQAPGFSVLALNNRNQLLAEHRLPAGCAPTTEAVLRRALAAHASALIIVRCAGAARPRIEPSDRAFYDTLATLCAVLSIQAHDLIVVGDGDWISLRQAGS